ncbi:MAG TPA: ZPR1 zinc finger domain-containing protein [Thermoplasmata archaeon]|nr:ZPR1 zinc finger domain-containing protein [Thermoplasmata archaeon]
MKPVDGDLRTGPLREMAVEGPCPHCGSETLVMRSLPLNLPYFGDALQTTVLCASCPFRHADLLLMNQGPPLRYELQVDSPAALSARVVRSSSCTVRVPEARARIEPGLRAEVFVSNAEGVLRRIRDVVAFVAREAEGATAKRAAERRIAVLDEMIDGHRPFTLILEDPRGNSAIVDDRAKKVLISDREAQRVQRGLPEFRMSS